MASAQYVFPKRFVMPSFMIRFSLLVLGLFFFYSLSELQFHGSMKDVAESVMRIAGEMFPPSLERLGPVTGSLLQTFEMAWIGSVIGLPISLFMAVLAARNTSPHPLVHAVSRGVITFLRTTPSLIWAIFLISAVGLGPRAGTVTLAISTIGFCGRFFAEAIEEIPEEPAEALRCLGATRAGILCGAVLPAAIPSFINTALFNLEHTTRSSAVLGIVGAGGIGIELMVSIQTFHYDEAATIMALVFIMVMAVEQCCALIRRKLI